MKRYLAALSAAMLLAAAMAPVATAVQNKVALCHYDTASNSWELLKVSDNGQAVAKHIAHGDVYPGDPVPNQPTETIFAAAFTDMNGDHQYQAPQLVFDATCAQVENEGDVLIAKIADTNHSGDLDDGDTIVMGQYPTAFAAPYGFQDWSVTSHLIATVASADSTSIVLLDDAGNEYVFTVDSTHQEYFEITESGAFADSSLTDALSVSGQDLINLQAGSPSAPTTDQFATQDDPALNSFIDVQITLPLIIF